MQAPRRITRDAITIGRELLGLEPLNSEFKSNLAIALDDLAGVVRDQREFESARRLFQEAEEVFAELVKSDPDHLQYRTRLLHTQLHRAAMERDLGQFTPAAGARCLGQLTNELNAGRWPDLLQPELTAIRRKCVDRAATLLVQAHERGFNDAGRLESGDFACLGPHPVYQSLLAGLKQQP